MPKMKTDKGAHKRFKKTANGFKRKRHLRAMTMIHKSDLRNIVNLLPYA